MTTTTDHPDLITPDQMTKLSIQLNEAGLGDRDEALAWMSGILGIELATRKDLTVAEASRLIDVLADGTVRKTEATEPERTPTVQEAVRRVMRDIGQIGVGKGGYNSQQNYRFRGIDQFVDAMSPILSRHGVVLLPQVREPDIRQYPNSKGNMQTMLVALVDWTIVGPGGDTLHATTLGQAIDSADKSANKLMSAAYKYLLSQVFSIPHDGWTDGDADSPSIEAPAQTDDVSDIIGQIEEYAMAESMTLEKFTEKFRRDNGGKTVEDLYQAPRPLLQAYLSRIEAFKAAQVERGTEPTGRS